MTTRRERQRQENREGILKAALTIAEREGWPAVTIRRIADEIEYTSPIIYQHFSNKEAALQVLMEQGYKALERTMSESRQTEDPTQRLLDMGQAYLRFARNNPRIYELMNGLGGVSFDPQVRVAAAEGVVTLTMEAIQTWADARNASLTDILAASETAWGVLHGMVSLGMLLDIGFERAEQLASDAMKALLHSWEVGL